MNTAQIFSYQASKKNFEFYMSGGANQFISKSNFYVNRFSYSFKWINNSTRNISYFLESNRVYVPMQLLQRSTVFFFSRYHIAE